VIGYLKGQIVDRHEEGVVLDVSGVGYDLQCSSNTLSDILQLDRDQVVVWVHTHLREDALSLFGFSTPLEKKMFLSLLKVNGIGPKMAIKILSAASLDQLTNMIEAGDVKALSSLPKVGKKTAEQLILSLKGKLVLEPDAGPGKGKTPARGANGAVTPKFAGIRGDVLSALVNLGFRMPDAERVVADMPEDIDLQRGVREGLQALTGV
jgi:holliday junction DNA helicase RuvA